MSNYDRPSIVAYQEALKNSGVWSLVIATALIIYGNNFNVSYLYLISGILYYVGFDFIFWDSVIRALEENDVLYRTAMICKALYRLFQHISFVIIALLLNKLNNITALSFVFAWYSGLYDTIYMLMKKDYWHLLVTAERKINWMGWSLARVFGKEINGWHLIITSLLGLLVLIGGQIYVN